MTNLLDQINAFKKLKPTSTAQSEQLKNIYYFMVELIIQGKYEEIAAGLKELRSADFAEETEIESVRRLITIRLSMKKGDPGDNTSWIDFPAKEDSWLSAEKLLVQGHWNFYLHEYDEGSKLFLEAEKKFEKIEMRGRQFVSAFNAIIGEVSGPKDLPPALQLEKLRALELRIKPFIEDSGCARVQAMVFRQKAHAFEDLNRFHASLEEITKAITIFELIGPASDYHLALLHAADICLDLKDDFKARGFFEYVIPPVDARVSFPMAFVDWRLGGPVPDKKFFPILPGGWKEKFEKLVNEEKENHSDEKIVWNQATGALKGLDLEEKIVIKLASLEGRLIKALTQEKATKNFLIEALWPEQTDVHLLDNRLHRMISRLNKKLNNMIVFDGKYYTLKSEIELI